MTHLTPDEIRALTQAELARRSGRFTEAVRDGRGEAILDFVRVHWFGDKTPFTVAEGRTDEWRTVYNLGIQKAFLDLVRFIEAATQETERPARAESALSAIGATHA